MNAVHLEYKEQNKTPPITWCHLYKPEIRGHAVSSSPPGKLDQWPAEQIHSPQSNSHLLWPVMFFFQKLLFILSWADRCITSVTYCVCLFEHVFSYLMLGEDWWVVVLILYRHNYSAGTV